MKNNNFAVNIENYCKICGGDFYADILTLKNMPAETFGFSDEEITLDIVKCSSCKAVQLANVPLNDNYMEVYRSIEAIPEYRKKKKKELKEFIEKYNLWDKKIFEFGCGNGQFLDIFRELGIEAHGFEKGNKNGEICIKKGYKVVDLLTMEFYQEYDLIFSSYVLEHMPDPFETMSIINVVLKPGGLIYLEIPNYDYIEQHGLWLEFTRDHRFYYNIESIQFLLKKVGFRIKHFENTTLTLKIIAEKINKFSTIREKMASDINKFNELTNAGEYALVGAGHYTQLFLRQIKYKPKYIYDSVPAKIGQSLCGIKIQDQNDIVNCDVQNIIISCGAYNNEAKKNIEQLVRNKNIIVWE